MDAVDKKERLLQIAAELFTEFGVRNTSVEQISKGAKVGKGTLYLYFADKEALFEAVLERRWEELSRGAWSSMKPGAAFMEKLLHLLTYVTAFRAKDAFFVKINSELSHFRTPEIEHALKKVQLQAIEVIEKLVQEGTNSGEIPAEVPSRMLAFLLVKAYAAFTYEWPKEYPAYAQEDLANLVTIMLGK